MYRKRKNEKCVQIIKRRSVRRRFHPLFMVDEASEKYAQVEMRKDAHVDSRGRISLRISRCCFMLWLACSLHLHLHSAAVYLVGCNRLLVAHHLAHHTISAKECRAAVVAATVIEVVVNTELLTMLAEANAACVKRERPKVLSLEMREAVLHEGIRRNNKPSPRSQARRSKGVEHANCEPRAPAVLPAIRGRLHRVRNSTGRQTPSVHAGLTIIKAVEEAAALPISGRKSRMMVPNDERDGGNEFC